MQKRFLLALALVGLLTGTFAAWFFSDRSTPPPQIVQRRDKPSLPVLPKPRAATAAERQGAIRSIRAQLDAFRRDDYESAARYQSQNLRHNFASTAAFQDIIEKSYPQFARSKSVTFGAAVAQGAVIQVPITLVGQDNVKVQAIYTMVWENGRYCVSGVSGGFPAGKTPNGQKPKVPPGFEGVAPLIT